MIIKKGQKYIIKSKENFHSGTNLIVISVTGQKSNDFVTLEAETKKKDNRIKGHKRYNKFTCRVWWINDYCEITKKEIESIKIKNYKNFECLQKEIRKNGIQDYFKVDGIIYTQEKYDAEGKIILYANKKHNKGFSIETENRYKIGFKDTIININEEWDFFRNDISYYE